MKIITSNIKSMSLVPVVLASLGISGLVQAAQVEVNWEEPKSYRDVRPANDSRTRFRERTFKELDGFFTELAAKLPENQKLSVTVTDLDLAGQVWPASFVGLGQSAADIRVIKEIDIPRMEFSYVLLDENSVELKKEDVKIKDLNFMNTIKRRSINDRLLYEKNMIENWFNDTFAESLASNN
ncbi:DUF3016 domain-containing protein [Alteromonas sp. 1_MG-2023]|uniref:DUF3016 domain-containing protein n=1 Tax=Alteromonas sp. 1_MG-2023 TaxID=3062669 RepID=UPI0026E251C0|nr:DUF3016 domain-containing protein [Alteromonas sp. 1_MG-2023]MDO6565714.1 DUF3016 domain-containing protein [Alteromonas sp. 1_MG-2023]